MTGFRQRLEQSDQLAAVLGRAIAGWVKLSNRHTRWTSHGLDDLARDIARGPVIVILWHEHLLMGPAHWPAELGDLTGIRDPSPMGRVAGQVQRAFGLGAAAMSQTRPNITAARAVLSAAKTGTSIAITADGPRGPRHEVKDAPLDWARAAGLPIYTYCWASTRSRRLNSWDRMILPLPFATGAYRFDRFSDTLPRRVSGDAAKEDHLKLQTALMAAARNVERMVGNATDDEG